MMLSTRENHQSSTDPKIYVDYKKECFMKPKSLVLAVFTLVAASGLLALMFGLLNTTQGAAAVSTQASERVQAVPVTVITVTSGTDPDTSDSYTCLNHTPCTLRRAVIQARNLSAGEKPVLIAFDIPEDAGEGYDSTLNIWNIEFSGISSNANAALRYLNGGIIIDGATQPGGRSDGPKIILVSNSPQDDGLKLGETGSQDGNEIRNLGFQNFKTHIYVNSSENIIEYNWFGLDDEGTAPYLRNGNPADGSGNTGVSIQSGAQYNLIQHNVFLGLAGVAAAIRDKYNTFSYNYVGTAADGSVDKQTDPDLICTPEDWLGGGGISVDGVVYSGINHTIENNIFAGLRFDQFSISTPPDAIRIGGTYHLIQNNKIGIDATGAEVGTCGRGIYLIASPHDMQVISNTIVDSGLSAISLNDVLYDAVLLRNNTVKKNSAWPEIEGNPKPEDAIQLGPSLVDPLENFIPAQVTDIDGTTVLGTSGAGSACPNCAIELFLDDDDAVKEALQSLAVVTADADGNWTATLPFELSSSQGLRTTSTTAKYGTIPGISAGTTTGLSDLYLNNPIQKTYLPFLRK
jgi:hypothetical protein